MKLGLDAKWYFRGPPSGRRIIRSLVGELATRPGVDLHLFLDEREREQPAAATPPGVTRHFVWARNNQLSNVAVVPRVADRHGMHAVVYQNFAALPPGVRHARIAFVHDVIFEESPEFFTLPERLYFAPLKALSRRATRVCTVSGSERQRMIRLGYAAAENIDVVPNAVDATFRPRSAFDEARVEALLAALGIRSPYALFVGRLTKRKNAGVLLRAMQLVSDRALTLVLAGARDRTSEDLGQLARQLGMADRVRFIGHQDDDHLGVLYAAAAIFCFPSLDESFGLPPLEAMSAGIPVIVSDIPVLRDMCGDAAVFVDPGDAAAIARGIDSLMIDAPRRAALGREGPRHAAQFTWAKAADALLVTVARSLEQVA